MFAAPRTPLCRPVASGSSARIPPPLLPPAAAPRSPDAMAPAAAFLPVAPTAATVGSRASSLVSSARPAAGGRAAVRRARAVVPPRMTMEAPIPAVTADTPTDKASVGLVGLAVMGQNLALNIADHGFPISVYNRSASKTRDTVARAEAEGLSDKLSGFEDMAEFVASLATPRRVIMLVKAGGPVDATISALRQHLEPGDMIIDGGNEFYTNTERRSKDLTDQGLLYMGMGVSGGEDGARMGPSLMPGGPRPAYEALEPMLRSIAAQVDDGPCVTYIGTGGAGNYVKMVHNGIEYGDMQLIGEAYDVLKTVGGLSAPELAAVFDEWNRSNLQSFLIEITAAILRTTDDLVGDGSALIEKVLDQTGAKGTGMWTVQEAAARLVPIPTIAAALEARYLSALKQDRAIAAKVLSGPSSAAAPSLSAEDKAALVESVRPALYASKICSYAQGMNLIRAAGTEYGWGLDLGAISRIWKGGCIIRAVFLDRIKAAYDIDAELPSLLVDPSFAAELATAQSAWRSVVTTAVNAGVSVPAMSGSLAYYDTYRRTVLPSAQMVQSQRDFFGSHTYKRLDKDGVYHTRWSSDGVTEEQ